MQRRLWFFIVFLVCVPQLRAQINATVSQIRIEGNRRIETDAILEKMSIKKGQALSSERVASDIRSIFSLGFFEDIRFFDENGVLVVKVKERPVVTEIVYSGSEEFQEKDLQEASGLKPFNVLSLDKIRVAETSIAKKYEEKGYYLARAETQVEPIAGKENEVRLKVQIVENEKVIVRKIFFVGNKVFPENDLKRVMLTSEGHVFSWATSGGTYREAAFERDLAALAYFYGNEGYIEAKFGKPRVTLSQDRRYIDVVLDVTEGEKFFLGDVTFNGDSLFTQEDLRKSFQMEEGDVFSTGILQQQILALTDKFGDEGYAFANVIPRTAIDPSTRKVSLDIQIEKGEKVYWGKIQVTGNTKTHDKVIRRELRFKEGELYNATKRKKSMERILRLGFFGNDVNLLTSSPEGTTDVLDLEIRVEEKPSGTLVVQAGYGNAAGFTFGAKVSQANLFGRGQQLSFDLQLSLAGKKDEKFEDRDQSFNLQFTDPKVFDSEWLAGFDLYYQKSGIGAQTSSYKQKLEGGALRIGREIYEDLNLYGRYKLEHYELQKPINPAIFTDPVKDAEAYISSLTATLALDRRNNRIDPSGGYYLSSSGEFAGLGGRVFQKFNFSARYYKKVIGSLVYRTNLEYGVLTNFMNNETVPDGERFTLGGVFSLRGYPSTSVGPSKLLENTRDRDKEGNQISKKPFNYPFGGTQKLIYINELETPLIPEADIRLAFFFDVGNAWDGINKESPALLANYGWGIRWYSPLGPLRFEWGYPLNTTPSNPDKGTEFHFIIAPTF